MNLPESPLFATYPMVEYYHYSDAIDELTRLKAEVERLIKAGDELHAFLINYIVEMRVSSAYLDKLDDGWNAAKDGELK